MAFQKLQALLSEIFNETIQNENELSFSSSTLVLGCLFQLYSRAPKYALFKERVSSFQNNATKVGCDTSPINSDRPISPPPLPSISEFASAGFFHIGYHDETVCGVCGLGLKDWTPTDKADESHTRFALSTAIAISESILMMKNKTSERISTAIPCLYVEVLRLLVSKLPLKRKNLVSEFKNEISGQCVDFREYIDNLASRLEAIENMLNSTTSLNWPVKNARNLGYSDDIIALGLWRQQSESTSTPISFVSDDSFNLNPQDTAVLLKSILRVQECGLDDEEGEPLTIEGDVRAPDAPLSTIQHSQEAQTRDDVEQESPINERALGRSDPDSSISEIHSSNTKLPGLTEILFWWVENWSHNTSNALK